jgi:hypothetical protein
MALSLQASDSELLARVPQAANRKNCWTRNLLFKRIVLYKSGN